MCNVDNSNNNNKILAKKVGTLSVSMYEDTLTGLPLFYIQSENEKMLQVSYVIEDTLYNF